MALKLLPYKAASESAKALSEALGIQRIRVEGSKYTPKARDVIINWGSSNNRHPVFQGAARILNHPDSVAVASNKLESFRRLSEAGVSIPEFTTRLDEARRLNNTGAMIVCRTTLRGHSGEGIVLTPPNTPDEIVPAPLYTEYIKKVDEYRIHVLQGEVFVVQRKARKREVPDNEVNWQIRNHANGFVFARQGFEIEEGYKDLAKSAVEALGLDFGAVDLIVTKRGVAYVLEVNTACGLEGQTLQDYADAFQRFK